MVDVDGGAVGFGGTAFEVDATGGAILTEADPDACGAGLLGWEVLEDVDDEAVGAASFCGTAFDVDAIAGSILVGPDPGRSCLNLLKNY